MGLRDACERGFSLGGDSNSFGLRPQHHNTTRAFALTVWVFGFLASGFGFGRRRFSAFVLGRDGRNGCGLHKGCKLWVRVWGLGFRVWGVGFGLRVGDLFDWGVEAEADGGVTHFPKRCPQRHSASQHELASEADACNNRPRHAASTKPIASKRNKTHTASHPSATRHTSHRIQAQQDTHRI